MKSGIIALVGRPNVGKSTLINAILEQGLSIVSPKAQTTRERVRGIVSDAKRGQIVMEDTPGLHRAAPGGINQWMVGESVRSIENADLVWYLVDPASAEAHEQAIQNALARAKCPIWPIVTKADLNKNTIPLWIESYLKGMSETHPRLCLPPRMISAVKDRGLTELMKDAWAVMPEGPILYPDPDQLSDKPTRFFVAEFVREQLFFCLGEELPYSCAVEIDKFDEKGALPRIEATIHVERETQKPMVIGAKGLKIKEIGSRARERVEEFLGCKVFLGLHVKVTKNWTQDEKLMERLGYKKNAS